MKMVALLVQAECKEPKHHRREEPLHKFHVAGGLTSSLNHSPQLLAESILKRPQTPGMSGYYQKIESEVFVWGLAFYMPKRKTELPGIGSEPVGGPGTIATGSPLLGMDWGTT